MNSHLKSVVKILSLFFIIILIQTSHPVLVEARQEIPPGNPASSNTAKKESKFKTGDAIEVLWRGSWWPAHVLESKDNSWKIHYDEYSSTWDEWVESNRIRPKPLNKP